MAAAAVLTVSSCASQKQLPENGIALHFMDTSVRPQDDFFTYVNGNWVKTVEIPSDKASWGSFNELREKTDENSLAILKNILTEKYAKGSEGQKIQDLYATYIDWDKRNAEGIEPIKGDLAKIDKDGYIFISGRKKFVIVLKNGKNIYPEELETLVNKIEGIKESFVYGKPEDDGDYKICCKIVYDKDNVKEIYGTDEEEKLKELIWQEVKKVNKTMPAYKYIREITLTDKELIKTTTQKIKRFEEMKNVI